MKNLGNRNKILLAIAAVVVVVVVIAVIVFTQVEPAELLGASLVGVSPSNPTIMIGQTVMLSASTSLSRCSWSSANTTVATVASNNKSAVVTGRAIGQAKINVKCGVGLTTGSTYVNVIAAPTPTPTPTLSPAPRIIASSCDLTLYGFSKLTLSTGNASTTWSVVTSHNQGVTLSATSGASVVVNGVAGIGTATVSARTPGSATGSIVLPIVSNRGYGGTYTVRVGQTTSVNSSQMASTFTIPSTCPSIVTMTPNPTYPGFTITGQTAGSTVVWEHATSGLTIVYPVTVTP